MLEGECGRTAHEEAGMIRECRAGDVERIKRWTEAEGGRSLFWLAMLDDITPEVILEAAVWRIAGRDGQLKGAPLSCGSSRPGLPAGWPDARSPPSGTPASVPRKPGTGSCTASMSGQLLEPRQGGSRAGTREVICYRARALPNRPGPQGRRRRSWPPCRILLRSPVAAPCRPGHD